ncbi:MAG: hypothetical protein QXT49_01970 [Candidatus Nezhaarchaeales archaeon]
MTGERVARPLQAGLTLTVDFGKPRKIVIPSELLTMISEETRKIVMDEVLYVNQRFKVLIEELHWHKGVSVKKLSKYLNVPLTTLREWMKYKLNVGVRDKVTALQLANTGRYKYHKRDFDGDGVEKLRMWFLAHTDGSVSQQWRQVQVTLCTPDPYLVILFKEAFGKYGYVGVAPRRNKEGYVWELWILPPLRSYSWLLERHIPTPIDSDVKFYNAFSIATEAEGSVSAWNRGGRTTEFKVTVPNEKVYVVEPLYDALKQRGYRVHLYTTPKGTIKHYPYNNDYHRITVYAKTDIKRLLENVELVLPHKRITARLIKHALREPSEPVYWSTIEAVYSEIEAVHEEMLKESKLIVKSLHELWRALTEKRKQKEITRTRYEEERVRLRAEAWKALEMLKAKYDERFKELERSIKAYFRARKPLTKHVLIFFKGQKVYSGVPLYALIS